MRNLIALANDGSDAAVRRTLYDSLPVLLHNAESANYLVRILPSLRDYIHDENEKVIFYIILLRIFSDIINTLSIHFTVIFGIFSIMCK